LKNPDECVPPANEPPLASSIAWSGTPACDAAGWCAIEAILAGLPIFKISGVVGGELFATSGNAVLRFSGGTGTVLRAPSKFALEDIFVVSATNIWGVTAGETIVHYDGVAWTQTTLASGSWLSGLWGSSASDIWAVGNFGVVGHFNGSGWTTTTVAGSPSFSDVWGTGPSDVWASAYDGKLFHYDGTWTPVTTGTTQWLEGVWSGAPNDAWVVGRGGVVRHGSATALATVTIPNAGTTLFNTVWGSSNSDVWVTASGKFFHWNGASWSDVPGKGATGLWGSGPNDVWATGGADGAWIQHWNGATWTTVLQGPTGPANAVWGDGKGTTWVAENDGVVLRIGAAGTERLGTGTKAALKGVWGSSADNVWIVGDKGTALHWTGRGLCPWQLPISQVEGISGSAPDDVWVAGGSDGSLAHFDGVKWTASKLPSTDFDTLHGVFVAGRNDAWVVGKSPWHFDGTTWTKKLVSGPASTSSYDTIWGTGSKDVYAAGTFVMAHWDGVAWTPIDWMTASGEGLGGTTASDVFVAGSDVKHWDGASWTSAPIGPKPSINALWVSPTEIWAAGDYGAVLRKTR
jgi:hypothetical protein